MQIEMKAEENFLFFENKNKVVKGLWINDVAEL